MRRSINITHPFVCCLALAVAFVVTHAPCFSAVEDVWTPDFDSNGIRSKVAATISESVRWEFIDRTGHFAIEPKYIRVKTFSDGGTTTVEDETGCFEIDKTGKQLTKPISRIQLHQEFNKKRWAREAKENEEEKLRAFKGDIFDAGCKQIIAKNKEVKVGSFSEGLAACIKQNGKYGYITHNGELILKPEYWLCGSFSNNRALIVHPTKTETTASTKETYYSTPVKSDTDVLQFLFNNGLAPDDSSWAGRGN